MRSDQITTKKIDLRETGKFWKKKLGGCGGGYCDGDVMATTTARVLQVLALGRTARNASQGDMVDSG